MKFKVGDKVEAIDNHYGVTTKKYGWEGVVTEVNGDYFTANTTKCTEAEIGESFDGLKNEHFELIKPKKTKNQRISALEKEVAELKIIVEDLRERKAVESIPFEELVTKEEIIEFEGAKYRKVEREAREGDVVVFKGTHSKSLANDKPYLAQILNINIALGEYQLAVAGNKCNCLVYAPDWNRTPETVDVYELIEQPKSPNQQRAEIIEKAKRFVEEHGEGFQFRTKDRMTIATSFKRLVIKGAECHPNDVFNEHIGKAIALGRTLGLDVSEFEQAVQPTVAVGQLITSKHGNMPLYTVITLDKARENLTYVSDEGKIRNAIGGNLPDETWYKIINDTEAIYGEVK